MNGIGALPDDWRSVLGPAASASALARLDAAVASERARGDVYPTAENVFAALRLTPYHAVRAVIIGQDPYHGLGEAHGLAFSVPAGVRLPPSLRNIRLELQSDLSLTLPESGSLVRWAQNGVLMLNAILTVAKDAPASHRKLGWLPFTEALIAALRQLDRPIAFLLWGNFARKLAGPIDERRHVALYTSHPSPLSARKAFLGSHPFSRANERLRALGAAEIDWRLE